MVTAKTQYSLANAKNYFEEQLCVGDYYEENQRISGEWLGLGAERLGLAGKVRAEDFLRLCDNLEPATGERLTQRTKGIRHDEQGIALNRRIFYDFCISPPKSVSVAAFIGDDERIVAAHGRAVRSALHEFEAFAASRIRVNRSQDDRLTGNFVSALFTHETSRAVDPHLHTHCIVFNATFDPVEQRWKALQNHELLQAKKFLENAYYHEVARELRSFGYRIQNRARGDFEVEGVTEELCERFSKRHKQIDEALAKLLAQKPELQLSNLEELRGRLATSERSRKQLELSKGELHTLWQSQVTPTERESLVTLRQPTRKVYSEDVPVSVTQAVQWAEEHLFDRSSVVSEHRIWQEALGHARGSNFSLSELKVATTGRGYIRDEIHTGNVTLREILLREWEIVRLAKRGVGEYLPLVQKSDSLKTTFAGEQRRALVQLLASTNLVSIFRGGAGTGKSFVLRELVEQLLHSGKDTVVIAPQRQQVAELEKAGFQAPTTVTSLLQSRELSEGAVIVVDEAGQVGGKQMLDLLGLVSERNGRLILSGDTRQHGPVAASDALLALERYSGIKPIELRKIRRQNPELARNKAEKENIKAYRKAVEAAAGGDLATSFARLDAIGAVIPCAPGEQSDRLAEEYVRLTNGDATVVVVSQTWSEVQQTNAKIRARLKENGKLGTEELKVETLEKLDLTDPQKRDKRSYTDGACIVFNQKVREAPVGAKGKLAGILKSGLLVEVDGRFVSVSNRLLDRVTVCLPREIQIAMGDRLHLKANRKLENGARATNGELVTVKAFRTNGQIELTDGRVLGANYREFMPGYAITSYGAQGKTADYVLFSDSIIKAATNAQQWYVSISRGRRGIRIFTPDKEQLRENIVRPGHRKLAIELAGAVHHRSARVWDVLHRYLLRFGRQAADHLRRIKTTRHRQHTTKKYYEHQSARVLG